jgi:hypothetical protein
MFFRSRIRGIAKGLLIAMLFAQAAIATAACDMPERTPAKAIAQEPAMPCHEEPVQNANLCLADCLSGDQSADSPQVALPAWNSAVTLTIEIPDLHGVRSTIVQHALPRPPAPPPRILFQTFLI